MDIKCMLTKEKILVYIGTKYTASEKQSLALGEKKLIGTAKPKRYTKDAYEKLDFLDQRNWDQKVKRYNDRESRLDDNLTTCYTII